MRCDVLLVAGGKAAAGDGHLYALKVERKVRDVRAAIAAGAALRIRDEAAFIRFSRGQAVEGFTTSPRVPQPRRQLCSWGLYLRPAPPDVYEVTPDVLV